MSKMENEMYNNRIHDLKANNHIWLANGLSVLGFSDEEHIILDECMRDVLTYPDEDKTTINDVRFIMWDGGKHWYAKIGKIDIVDDNGNQKWDTMAEAKQAANA